jgi:fatty acid desaturase
VGLGHRLDSTGVEALPQLHSPHVHQHSWQGQRSRLRNHADRPRQKWHPVYLAQPFYNVLLTAFFEWGVALHDLDLEAFWAREKSLREIVEELRGIAGKARQQVVKDYIGWPLVSAAAFGLTQLTLRGRIDQPATSRIGRRLRRLGGGNRRVGVVAAFLDRAAPGVERAFLATLAADFTANIIRNIWAHAIIFCGHFPDQTYTFSQDEVADETRGGWYVRQLVGAANIDGSPLFHVISGNLGYQVEHHLYPDMPSTRYSEVAPKVKDICERYALPYNTGPFSQQWGMVHRTIFRLAFPGGKPRPKPGPYHGASQDTRSLKPGEAARFRQRVPASRPEAGPEHKSGGVEVSPPPRDR